MQGICLILTRQRKPGLNMRVQEETDDY